LTEEDHGSGASEPEDENENMEEEVLIAEESRKDNIEPTYLDEGFSSVEAWLEKC
jgi:hypothetical protein